jgi:hypothetical protein
MGWDFGRTKLSTVQFTVHYIFIPSIVRVERNYPDGQFVALTQY